MISPSVDISADGDIIQPCETQSAKRETKVRPQASGRFEMTTKTIPTDKNGNVYYGPKTVAQAEVVVYQIVESESELPIEAQTATSKIVLGLAEKMNRAGYAKAASNLRKQYDV
jgi:hypothetical protein